MTRAIYEPDMVMADGIWVDVRAYGSVTTDVTIQTAITSIGSDDRTLLIPPGTWTINNNITIPSNIRLRVEMGAVLSIATGKTVTINGSLEDGMHQMFSGLGNVAGMRKLDFLRPEWFGAVGDYSTTTRTGTDDSAAFQKCFDTIHANTLSKVRLGMSNYYIATSVNIDGGGIIVEGPSASNRENPVDGKFEGMIYGSASLEAMFILGNLDNDSMGGIDFNGVSFCGRTGAAGVNEVESAIKIKDSFGPLWPLVIERCFFSKFNTAAIYAYNPGEPYNLAFVSITKCAFQGCQYSILLDTTAHNNCQGLYFVDNRAHQGGAIKGSFGSGVEIANNNLEDQETPIDIVGYGVEAYMFIHGNYFEATSGDYIIKLASNVARKNNVILHGNRYNSATPTSAYIYLSNVGAVIHDDVSVTSTLSADLNVKQLVNLGRTNEMNGFKASFVSDKGLKDNVVSSKSITYPVNGTIATPFGLRPYSRLASTSIDSGSTGLSMTSGQTAVYSVLVRYTEDDNENAPAITFFENGGATLKGHVGTPIKSNDWTVITGVYLATGAVTDLQVKFYPYGDGTTGDGCYVAGCFAYIASDEEYTPYIDWAGAVERTTTTILTAAQVQALETTPIELVPAQGTHSIIEFVSAVMSFNYSAVFTVTNADNKLRVQYDGSTDVSEAIDMNTFLEGPADTIRIAKPDPTSDTNLISQVNKKLELFNEGTGDVTGGTGSTLVVTTIYRVHYDGLG